jgi:hypothetical protein
MAEWFDLDENDERAITAFMSRVASLGVPDPGSRIPDPAELWCKAKLLARWDAERRARRPLEIMMPVEIAGGLVAAGLLLYWSIPYLL